MKESEHDDSMEIGVEQQQQQKVTHSVLDCRSLVRAGKIK